MRQFDAYRNPASAARDIAPYLVILSSHHLSGLDEVVVAPAITDATRYVRGLELEVTINDRPLTLVVSDLSSIDPQRLRQKAGSLASHEDDIRRALDRLFTGF